MGVRSHLQDARRALVRSVLALGLALAVGAPSIAAAGEGTTALQAVSGAGDFRVRVSAALVLGRVKPSGSLDALSHALADAHPAVRVASAEALASLGDAGALPALSQRAGIEASPTVKEQIPVTMASLRQGGRAVARGRAAAGDVRYVIAFGAMRNGTGVRGEELSQVLSDAARARTHELRGAAVGEGHGAAEKQAAGKHLPVITLDGNVAQMVESRQAGTVQVHARVEFTVRYNQTLKGVVSGAATTYGSGGALSDEARRQLQNDAVDGAVQSALHGAEQGLIVAAR